VSPTRTESPVVLETQHWRPMAFDFKQPARIRDPLCEPLWGGERVLVEVAGDAVRMRDVERNVLEGYEGLHDAIAESAEASELVLDGYLLPAPLGALVDEAALAGTPDAPSSGSMARQFFLGGIGQPRHGEQLDSAAARLFDLPPDEPTAFVAIDLLWLDGESLLDIPLQERKRLLDAVLRDQELVRRTVLVHPPVETWYRQWRAFGFHEFAIKDANSRYIPGGETNLWTTAAIPRR
jgi:ATP-dependent DNA ligase